MAQRVYKNSAVYECRIVGMRNLWEPSTEYMGDPCRGKLSRHCHHA
jgi:hypothetical protein